MRFKAKAAKSLLYLRLAKTPFSKDEEDYMQNQHLIIK